MKVLALLLVSIVSFNRTVAQNLASNSNIELTSIKNETTFQNHEANDNNDIAAPIVTIIENNDGYTLQEENRFEEKVVATDSTYNMSKMYDQGQQDAQENYKGNKITGTVSLLTSMIFPPYGFLPTVVLPLAIRKKNLNCPNPELLNDPNYHNGYVKMARHIKSRQAWRNFGIGAGIFILVIVLSFFYLLSSL